MKRLNCCRDSIKSFETPNVFALRRQAANSIECRLAMGWRCFSSVARRNQCDVHSRLAKLCKIIGVFRCGWELKVGQSTVLAMLTTQRTLQDRRERARHESWLAE